MIRLIAFVAVLSSVMGCRAHNPPASIPGPGLNAKREASLIADAVAATGCPKESLTPSFVESIEKNAHIYKVEGCGKTYQAILHCAGVCTWVETPEKRASFDLQCPMEQLTRTYLGQGTFGMTGCGRTITYLYVNGRLVANSTTNVGATPPPPPAPPAR